MGVEGCLGASRKRRFAYTYYHIPTYTIHSRFIEQEAISRRQSQPLTHQDNVEQNPYILAGRQDSTGKTGAT